jgi:hypothetical protein
MRKNLMIALMMFVAAFGFSSCGGTKTTETEAEVEVFDETVIGDDVDSTVNVYPDTVKVEVGV